MWPGEYYKCSGERLPFEKPVDAIGYLKKIPYILSLKNQRDDTIWYVRGKTFSTNAPCSHIFRCKTMKSPGRHVAANRTARTVDPHNMKQRYLNGSHNGDISKRSGFFETNDHDKRCACVLRTANILSTINISNPVSNSLKPFFAHPKYRNYSKGSHDADGHNSYRNSPKTSAAIHSYDLVGDDFFMEMARIDLNRPYVMRMFDFIGAFILNLQCRLSINCLSARTFRIEPRCRHIFAFVRRFFLCPVNQFDSSNI